MNKNKVRANDFDRRVGEIQTLKAIEMGMGDSVLDVGCGIGQYTPLFLHKFKTVVGLDPSEKYLKEARQKCCNILYTQGFGETFKTEMRFDTVSLNNVLEHVDDPIKLLKNCKKHLAKGGRMIVQVPNSQSITRRLGVLMGIIDSELHISEKEKYYYGHKRTYSLKTLANDCKKSGLKIIKMGGILYKPLPNETLEELCKKNGKDWANRFISALVNFGEDRPDECACIYVLCK